MKHSPTKGPAPVRFRVVLTIVFLAMLGIFFLKDIVEWHGLASSSHTPALTDTTRQ